MPQDPDRPAPPDFDHPNAARIHDWLLGGTLNTALDRDAADLALGHRPGLRDLLRHNRAFLHRATGHMITTGIRQFLDLGSGLPTTTPTHHVAHAHDRTIPVVYVDNDPTTVAHTRLILDDTATATVVEADLRRPGTVLGHPRTRRLLDLDRPVGILAVDILDTLAEDPGGVLGGYLDAVAPGSAIALTHVTTTHPDAGHPETGHPETALPPRIPRPPATIATWLAGLDLVPPGLVAPWEWRTDREPDHPPGIAALCALGSTP